MEPNENSATALYVSRYGDGITETSIKHGLYLLGDAYKTCMGGEMPRGLSRLSYAFTRTAHDGFRDTFEAEGDIYRDLVENPDNVVFAPDNFNEVWEGSKPFQDSLKDPVLRPEIERGSADAALVAGYFLSQKPAPEMASREWLSGLRYAMDGCSPESAAGARIQEGPEADAFFEKAQDILGKRDPAGATKSDAVEEISEAWQLGEACTDGEGHMAVYALMAKCAQQTGYNLKPCFASDGKDHSWELGNALDGGIKDLDAFKELMNVCLVEPRQPQRDIGIPGQAQKEQEQPTMEDVSVFHMQGSPTPLSNLERMRRELERREADRKYTEGPEGPEL